MGAKLSEFIPPLGMFIRMPVGSTVYYPVDDFSDMKNISSYARRAGGKIKISAIAGVKIQNCEVHKLLRCEVEIMAKSKEKPGRKRIVEVLA